MKLKNNNHLMYCQSIHPGEDWPTNFAAIQEYSLQVKERICPEEPMAIGLRLSAIAALQLEKELAKFKRFLEDNNLYVVSVNGFPYGAFHRTRVKENVYLPDWSARERVDYIITLIRILEQLLPEGEIGTISTVPCHYGKTPKPKVVSNLLLVSDYLEQVELNTGKRVILALEPEPDCYLDTLNSTTEFFSGLFRAYPNAAKRIGVCIDTCHAAVEFESPTQWYRTLWELGIMVPKIQLSAALKGLFSGHSNKFQSFNENTYLHQTRIRNGNNILRFNDLDEALSEAIPGEWRVHFHVPLVWQGEQIKSTIDTLADGFLEQVLVNTGSHVEIETYSFEVLPGEKPDLVTSIAAELEWAKEKLDQRMVKNVDTLRIG